ncbi:MAG: hypothetical protein WC712_09270, partial [Candidatus Brocadiia bacterium]
MYRKPGLLALFILAVCCIADAETKPLILDDWMDVPRYITEGKYRPMLDKANRAYCLPWQELQAPVLPNSYKGFFGNERPDMWLDVKPNPLLQAYSEGYRHWTLCYFHYAVEYPLFVAVEKKAADFTEALVDLDAANFAGPKAAIGEAFAPPAFASWEEHPIHAALDQAASIRDGLPQNLTEDQEREARLCFDITAFAMLLCDKRLSDSMKFVTGHHMMRSILSTKLIPPNKAERLRIHESLCRDLWEYAQPWTEALAAAEASRIAETYHIIWGPAGRDYLGMLMEAGEPKYHGQVVFQMMKSHDTGNFSNDDKQFAYALTLPWQRRVAGERYIWCIPDEKKPFLQRYAENEMQRKAPTLDVTVKRFAGRETYMKAEPFFVGEVKGKKMVPWFEADRKGNSVTVVLTHPFFTGPRFFASMASRTLDTYPWYDVKTEVNESARRVSIAVCSRYFLTYYAYVYEGYSYYGKDNVLIGKDAFFCLDDLCYNPDGPV